MPFPPQFLYRVRRLWNSLLGLGFGALCVRFLFAANREFDGVPALFTIAGFALGYLRPLASLSVLALSFSLLSGLERTVLHAAHSTHVIFASALWLGWSLRKFLPNSPPDPADTGIQRSNSPTGGAGWMILIVEMLMAVALLSVLVQIMQQRATPGFGARFGQQASFGPSDPLYFLTSGFLWLHGLFYFRALNRSNLITNYYAKLVFLVNGIVLMFFFNVQWLLEVPFHWTPGFQSPFEDIATFGIMAVCQLIFLIALPRRDSPLWLILHSAFALFLLIAVGASWSRGTWLAGGTFLVIYAVLRLPRSLAVVIPVALLGTVILLNLNAERISLMNLSFLNRLVSLVRFEEPRIKSSVRIELYHKAWAMIQIRPWTGHGIGTFAVRGPAYARPGDPNAAAPQLAHNILLQLATEQGIPVTILFACLIGWPFTLGLRCWILRRRIKIVAPPEPEDVRSMTLALTMALGAYIQANMTWDMLLVHPTQPFFFWFLVATLWVSIERANNPSRTPAMSLG